ncbi:MAG: OmpA family protein [Methylobacter sp.]|nr:OmpA family protein [Methylobacter sp.]
MQNIRYLPLSLIAAAVVSGCSAVPTQSLLDARSRYSEVRTNPEVTNLAPVELKRASDSLNKAEYALSEDEDENVIDHLAYIARQQTEIALVTAQKKTAEIAVTTAGAKRDKVRLDARTAEADEANYQVELLKENVNWQATELAVANANTARDQELIAQQDLLLKALNAKKTERGMMITLSDVLFSTGKAQLKSGGVRNVYKLADFLNKYPSYKVLIEGHTDSVGNDENNQLLSERRANAVRAVLTEAGIANDRIGTRGYGEGFPIAGNNNAGSRQLNRRVEIILSDVNGNIVPR